MAERFECEGAAVLRRNRRQLLVSAVPSGLGLWMVALAVVFGASELAIPALPLFIMSFLGGVLTYRANDDPIRVPRRIAGDREGLHIDGRLAVRRSRITSAFVQRGSPPVVRIERGLLPELSIEVRDTSQGRELLSALGFDASREVLRLRAASGMLDVRTGELLLKHVLPLVASIVVITLSASAKQPLGVALGAVMAALAGGWVLRRALERTRVEIAAEGVRLSWAGRVRLLRYDDITGVRVLPRVSGGQDIFGVEIALRAGERVYVPCGTEQRLHLDPAALVAQLQEARSTYADRPAAGAVPALERRGRSHRAWITELRRIGAGASVDHRTAALDPDALVRVLEDPDADPAARAAAAIAAAPADPEIKERIRIAASTTASPKLRVALEHAANDEEDDAALEEALAALEREVH